MMRPDTEIRAMRDLVHRRNLNGGSDPYNNPARVVLDWVCDGLVPDMAVHDLEVEPGDERELWEPEVIMNAFAGAFDPGTDKTRAQRYLTTLNVEELTELGAAARRLDRLCKAENERRNPERRGASENPHLDRG